MLQQTQVKTVIAYYNKWLIEFPTLEALAEAEEESVMACWAGLGYYSRAKRLRQAAQYLVTEFTRKRIEFPRDAEHWVKKVPGVGPYTAGAILSIAFGISSPIVDGNVQRVLSRILAIHGDTSTPKSIGSKLIWERAGQLVVGDAPGNLNQSLMELGATVCSPTKPDCLNCCVAKHCIAFAQVSALKQHRKGIFQARDDSTDAEKSTGVHDIEDLCQICPSSIDPSVLSEDPGQYIQGLYPFKPAKRAQKSQTAIVLVNMSSDQVYLEKKAKGLLAGLYDFPTILLDDTDSADCDAMLAKHKKQLNARLVGTTLHLFTHIRRTSLVLVGCSAQDSQDAMDAFREEKNTGIWVNRDQIATLGVSELCLKNWRVAQEIKEKVAVRPRVSQVKPQSVKKRRLDSVKQVIDKSVAVRVTDAVNSAPKVAVASIEAPVSEKSEKTVPVLKQSTIFTLFGRPRKS